MQLVVAIAGIAGFIITWSVLAQLGVVTIYPWTIALLALATLLLVWIR